MINKINDFEILICVTGTLGDIHPFIGIGSELRRRGAKVIFLVNDHFRELIERHSFEFFITGTGVDYAKLHENPLVWENSTDLAELGWESYYLPSIRKELDYVASAVSENRNIAVLGIQPLFNGALIAAESFKIPAIEMQLSPKSVPSYSAPSAPIGWLLPKSLPRFLRRAAYKRIYRAGRKRMIEKNYFHGLNHIRNILGLKPLQGSLDDLWTDNARLQIGLFPAWFGMPADDWPEYLNMTGFPLFDEVHDNARQIAIRFLRKHSAPLLFTSGTGVSDKSRFFEEGLKICEMMKRPGIFVGGRPINFPPEANTNCLYLSYIDFEFVFPHCSIVLHHGGIGTMAQAVRAGVPQFIRPKSFDQFDNADRVKRLDLGSYILPEKFEAAAVVPKLEAILSSSRIKHSVSAHSKLIKNADAVGATCDLIETYLIRDNGRFEPALARAVSQALEQNREVTRPSIRRLMRRTRRMSGTHESVASLLDYFGKPNTVADLYQAFPSEMGMAEILATMEKFGLKSRALRVKPSALPSIKLPCLIQWQNKRFILLTGYSRDRMLVFDPVDARSSLKFSEFNWNYTEYVIEIDS